MFQSLDFSQPVAAPWRVMEIGSGAVHISNETLLLKVLPTPETSYSDAQISDYAGKRDFRWRPPLRLTVRAYTTSPAGIQGTAGFGFWNHPFVPGERGFRLPQAVWFFFGSPPNEMQLALDIPGAGWKAATIDAARWQFLALIPAAPIGFLLMRSPALYNRLWPIGQWALGVSERQLDRSLLAEPHTYILDWRASEVVFAVDGIVVHQTDQSPRGPLGFIAWIDNQYAIVTPQGRFGFGKLAVEHEQTLVLEQVIIEKLTQDLSHSETGF